MCGRTLIATVATAAAIAATSAAVAAAAATVAIADPAAASTAAVLRHLLISWHCGYPPAT